LIRLSEEEEQEDYPYPLTLKMKIKPPGGHSPVDGITPNGN
jgi:hypothetical protein